MSLIPKIHNLILTKTYLEQRNHFGHHHHNFYMPKQILLLISSCKLPYHQSIDVNTKFSFLQKLFCNFFHKFIGKYLWICHHIFLKSCFLLLNTKDNFDWVHIGNYYERTLKCSHQYCTFPFQHLLYLHIYRRPFYFPFHPFLWKWL